MSLINQVLNELERRGADTVPLGETTLRAVPPREKNHLLRNLLLATVPLILLALWWRLERDKVAVIPPPPSPVRHEPTAAMPDALQTASAPAAAPSAFKLSFELSGIPLPGASTDKELAVQEREREAQPVTIRKDQVRRDLDTSADKVAVKRGSTASGSPNVPLKQVSPRQRIENDFRKANLAAQQGKMDEALTGYESVLRLDPLHHAARRALVGVLLGAKRNADAEKVLQEGLKVDSHEASLAMLLARLQVERDAVAQALETLERSMPYAEGQADYHAFTAALLQRETRHKEAIVHFQIALQLQPGNGIWLMGLGISMQAVERKDDARDAYQRSLATQSLSPELTAIVQQKLKGL